MADSNIQRTEREILSGIGAVAPVASRPWDGKRAPKYLDRVAARLDLGPAERALLAKNGFFVSAREDPASYGFLFHEIYRSELPIYVSADAILHAVFVSNDALMADVERSALVPKLGALLAALHCALPAASAEYPAETARDADLYLTVARTLLAGAPVPGVLEGTDASSLVAEIERASGMPALTLFGRERVVDFSQYDPRGHYVDKAELQQYFRAAMWLSRLELNLVSRSSRSSQPGLAPNPEETPREAALALALSDLVERSGAGADLASMERAWELFAGRREDVGMRELGALRRQAGIGRVDRAAQPALARAIGAGWQRTARLHYMPPGSKDLPVIATMLGARVTGDTGTLGPLTHSEVPGRYLPTASDVAYVLGHDRAKVHLTKELAAHPDLGLALDRSRARLAAAPVRESLYDAWLSAVRGLAAPPQGVTPSFMRTPEFADLRVDEAVAAYGQLRHNFVLMAGQEYSEGGCEIPDGWVDPVPAVYAGIVGYAERGGAVMKELDPTDRTGSVAYFAELAKIGRVLGAIAKDELEGRPLSTAARQFLAMIVDMSPSSTGGHASYTGWYFDLFRGREETLATAAFVSDYFTGGDGRVAYVGADEPRVGVFVVDTGGEPRVVVGPVARGWELDGTTDARLDDAAAREAPGKREPWAASYVGPAPTPPPLGLNGVFDESVGRAGELVLLSKRALPRVVVELLDHHRRAFSSQVVALDAGRPRTLRYPGTPLGRVEGVRVKVGEWSAVIPKYGVGGGVSLEVGGGEAPTTP